VKAFYREASNQEGRSESERAQPSFNLLTGAILLGIKSRHGNYQEAM
ncbi:hypothetical protein HKBW3S44_01543, partial [Candidatus Hakubella thermalkaliphila]